MVFVLMWLLIKHLHAIVDQLELGHNGSNTGVCMTPRN